MDLTSKSHLLGMQRGYHAIIIPIVYTPFPDTQISYQAGQLYHHYSSVL